MRVKQGVDAPVGDSKLSDTGDKQSPLFERNE